MTVLGFVLYGSTVLVPLMLQDIARISSGQGWHCDVAAWTCSFLAMPLVGLLMSKIEPRRLLAAGILFSSLSFWKFSHLNLDVGYWDFFIPLIIQGSSIACSLCPSLPSPTIPFLRKRSAMPPACST